MTIGEAVAASFGPSNYWAKIIKMKFIVALGGRQSTLHTTTKQINAGVMGEKLYKAWDRRGTQGGQYSTILWAVELGGGRE